MINLISFSDSVTGNEWYFNHVSNTFVFMNQADLEDTDFWTDEVHISEQIAQIALSEFGCSESYLQKALSFVVFEF
jgi:hypothetical protein